MTITCSSSDPSQFSTDIETFKRILNASYQLGELASKRSAARQRSQNHIYRPRMDVLDDPSSEIYRAVLELPGLKAEEVKLQVRQGHLCVYGERRNRLNPQSKAQNLGREMSPMTHCPSQEIRYGRFYRAIRLPSGSDPARIKASMVDGMLTIDFSRVPNAERATPPPPSSPHAISTPPPDSVTTPLDASTAFSKTIPAPLSETMEE